MTPKENCIENLRKSISGIFGKKFMGTHCNALLIECLLYISKKERYNFYWDSNQRSYDHALFKSEQCMVDPWMSIEFLIVVRIIHGYPSNSWMFMDVFG